MITMIDDYFAMGCGRCERFSTADCSTRKWAVGLAELRRICLGAGLVETVKWGHPCYMHADRNIAIMGALRGDFRLSFFEAGLMKDSEGVLERQGPNTRHPDMIRFTDESRVLHLEAVIKSYLVGLIGYAEAGIRATRDAGEVELLEELAEALGSDPELAEAFGRLTPGRRRSDVIQLSSAKKRETRVARIAGFRDRILAGKGAMER
jgi:uncharacterized protein YdeI (YjbR/CyaY-like superfamily)